jgi:hypothetical protein
LHCPDYGIPALDDDDWRLIYHDLCAGRSSVDELGGVAAGRRDYVGRMDGLHRAGPPKTLKSGRSAKLTCLPMPPEVAACLGIPLGMQGRMSLLDGKVAVVYDYPAPNYCTVKTADLSSFGKTPTRSEKGTQARYPKHLALTTARRRPAIPHSPPASPEDELALGRRI